MAKKVYKEKSPCDDIDCPHYEWRDGQNKCCVKPKDEPCPLKKELK